MRAPRRLPLGLALVVLWCATAHADDPRRKVAVIEYRSGSAALQGIAKRVAAAIGKATSLDVLGPDQMRAVYGDSIDQAIVKCSGEAECVAKIGQKVGAVSIILVGISELGDAILTMQLIDVKTHAVGNRIADSLPVDKVPSDANVDAYLQRLLPPTDFVRFGVIDIVANLAGASVTVGGKPRGVTPIESLKLPAPATYDIRIEKQGYVPYTTKVKLPPDGTMKVEADLSKKGAGAAWYQHWYVLAGAGLLVAGAAGTTIYFATAAPSNDRIGVTGEIR
jgi:hypothetical protein